MHDKPDSMRARIDAWREEGAGHVAPLDFALIDALARRAEHYAGSARRELDTRLSQLVDAYAARMAIQPTAMSMEGNTINPAPSLRVLLEEVPQQQALPLAVPARDMAQGSDDDAGEAPLMPVLDEFQQLWSRIRIDSLLRQCLDSLPEDAGPLHSSVLTYRAMALMQDISPDYLQHFIAYVDVLTWMEPLSGTSTVVEPVRAASKRKPGRRKN